MHTISVPAIFDFDEVYCFNFSWASRLRKKQCVYFFFAWINHTPIIPATKTFKAHVYWLKNPSTFPRKHKIAPKTFPTIVENHSTVSPVSHLRASARFFSHFILWKTIYKRTSSFSIDIFNSKCICWDGYRKNSKCWYYCNTLLTE